MINRANFRSLLESRYNGNHAQFGIGMRHLLGLCDAQGRPYYDDAGNRCLRDPSADQKRINPHLISMRGLCEAFLGSDPESKTGQIIAAAQHRELLESRALLEDNGAGAIMASAFADVNAWTAVTTGLLDVGILEAYQSPEFIAEEIAPAVPSKIIEGRKIIGAARLGDVGEERLPGMPTKRAQFGERWLQQPRTVENAVMCELTQEVAFLDITGGQVTEHANSVGEWIAYRKELRCIDSFIGTGQVSTANGFGVYLFSYKGTNYNPYQTAGTLWTNDIASGNQLNYIDNIITIELLFRNMFDPETGTLVLIKPDTLLVNRELLYTAQELFGGDQSQYRSAPGATTGQQLFRMGPNPVKGKYKVIESPLVYQECNSATGLNLGGNSGQKYWLFERGKRTHVYVQNWPLRTQTAAPNQVDLIDRGIILAVKADERGIPMWMDPRRVVRSSI